jgi:hypothetical protein
MRILSTVAILLALLLVVPSFHQSFALIEGFQRTDFKLAHNPTICAVEPLPDSNFPSIGNRMLTQTEYAVIDWYTKLNTSVAPTTHHPIWKISLDKIFLWQQKTFDYSICDIVINYKEKPDDPALLPQWIRGEASLPSIMIPTVIAIGNSHFDITPYDIYEIKSKYGNNGFGEPAVQNLTLIPDWIKTNAKSWAKGSLTNDDFIEGLQYLLKEKIINASSTNPLPSQSSTQIPSWLKNNSKWWANNQISDDEFVKGIQYLIQYGIIKI